MPGEESGFTDAFVEHLLSSPKVVVGQSHVNLVERGGHLRRDLDLESRSGSERFRVFLRKAIDAPWDFSIVLVFRSNVWGSVVLFRCNGDHGPHRNPDGEWIARGCHIHKATQEAWERRLKLEHWAWTTNAYTTFDEAKGVFASMLRIENWHEYVEDLTQGTLDFPQGGDAGT